MWNLYKRVLKYLGMGTACRNEMTHTNQEDEQKRVNTERSKVGQRTSHGPANSLGLLLP